MSRRLLPGLGLRATRVRLLAWTYRDAVEGRNGAGGTHGRLESSIPSRNGELWERGSYQALEHAMNTLRQRDRMLFGIFEKLHVCADKFGQHDEEKSVDAIELLMPPTIIVPAAIMLAAGYSAVQARPYARRWDADDEFGKQTPYRDVAA